MSCVAEHLLQSKYNGSQTNLTPVEGNILECLSVSIYDGMTGDI